MEHQFTPVIIDILKKHLGRDAAQDVFEKSPLLQYVNIKTASATRGSKARGSFANLYAIYVLIEDYIKHNFHKGGNYSKYEGAKFSDLFKRQRELPFGSKLQNHALNHRMNQEFKKHFPRVDFIPILRVVETKRYWINNNLLIVSIGKKKYNIAKSIIEIIDEYVRTKKISFENFIDTCEKLKQIAIKDKHSVEKFIIGLLAPNLDARVFEIVSYAILKYYYHDQTVFFGFDIDSLEEAPLKLYKTGRTNANDGGIDFVMRPLGRFFQVTETLDVKKYFLDIDKIERYPIAFVIKSDESINELKKKLKEGAERQYSIKKIVQKYMDCIEEIINIPVLRKRFVLAMKEGYLQNIINEIIRQSKVEFNYEEPENSLKLPFTKEKRCQI